MYNGGHLQWPKPRGGARRWPCCGGGEEEYSAVGIAQRCVYGLVLLVSIVPVERPKKLKVEGGEGRVGGRKKKGRGRNRVLGRRGRNDRGSRERGRKK